MSGYCSKCGWQICVCDEKEPLSSHAVLADVRAIIDGLYKKEIDDDIYSSKDLIKAKRIDEYNNALNDVKEKLSEHFS